MEECLVKYISVYLTAVLLASTAWAAEEIPSAPATDSAEQPTIQEATGSVARSGFSSAIVDREPVDQIGELPATADRVYFFTELMGLEGETVTHRWTFEDQTMAEVPFEVRGPRWRVHSSKLLQPGWEGTWTVTVVDSSGHKLAESQVHYMSGEETAAEVEDIPAAPAATDENPLP